jgi:deazaflavin-dependent oxidoreductase (nitroreductase family)
MASPHPSLNPKDVVAKVVTGLHRAMYDLSRGRIGGDLLNMPVIKLTTVGRKSGERRTTMLTVAHELRDSLVIIASYGGDDRHPAWFLNLEANPDVEVETRGWKRPMRARVVTGDERAQLWSDVARTHPNYAGYQRRTEREIPVVVLEPR